jgi:hypothetical protein
VAEVKGCIMMVRAQQNFEIYDATLCSKVTFNHDISAVTSSPVAKIFLGSFA